MARESLPEKTAAALERAIRDGHFTGTLPGYRDLCRTLQVSRTALEPALGLLVRKGVLCSAGQRKRYRIAVQENEVERTTIRKLWMLEPTTEDKKEFGMPIALLEPLEKRLRRLGWSWESSLVPVDQRRSHRKLWDRLLSLQNPDAILLVNPHRRTGEWAMDCGVPVCCLGGDVLGLPLSVTGFQSTHMVDEAVRRLLESGHRDLCLPLSVQTPGFVARIYEAMERGLAAHGITFMPGWHVLLAEENSPEALADAMARRFARRVPDALLVFGWGLRVAMGFLLNRGIKVPGDISLVMLGNREGISWFWPPVASFHYRWNHVVSYLAHWLARDDLSAPYPSELFNPEWVEGASVERRI